MNQVIWRSLTVGETMNRMSLIHALLFGMAAPLQAQTCPKPLPCVDCSLSYSELSELSENLLLYWDACQNEKSESPILYYLPSSVEPLVKNGKRLIQLREQANGDLILSSKMGFYPWNEESEINKLSFLTKLKQRYAGLRFAPITPKTYELKLLGKWASWTKNQKFFSTSGLDFHQPLPLTVLFDKQYATQVKEAFKRPTGMMGSLQFTYEVYDAKGSIKNVKHNIPFHLSIQ